MCGKGQAPERTRAVEPDGEPWLVGKDVARALGYSDPYKALAGHVDEEDKREGGGRSRPPPVNSR